jgi:hypothetical protein
MPARNRYHAEAVRALEKDGWTVAKGPLYLRWGARTFLVDLDAARGLAAEKDARKIAVEVQSFLSASQMEDLEHVVGQFTVYRKVLERQDPERQLYMAVPVKIYRGLFQEPIGQLLLEEECVRLLVFDPQKEEIVLWTP